jgi:hypothetical protein
MTATFTLNSQTQDAIQIAHDDGPGVKNQNYINAYKS